MSLHRITIDQLAQIIRKVDGNHSLGAGALAEAILAEISPARLGNLVDLGTLQLPDETGSKDE